jgi:hypothetical protein
MSVISSEEFWAEFHKRTKHMEEMLGTLLARSQGHREEDQSNSASSSRHQASRDSIQIQNFCAKDPSHTSPSQVITLSPSLLENLPKKQPTKETPPSPSPLENLPKQQPTKETSTPPPSKDPEPITAQKKDQPPRFPQTLPPINPSAQTLSLPKIPAKTQKKKKKKRRLLLAKTESSATTNTPKIPTMFTHRTTTPTTTSKPSHPLPDFLNPAVPIPQDHQPSATNPKDQTKKTTPTVETLPLSH